MSQLFISHSSLDGEIAAEVRTRLETLGHHSVFLDFDPAHGIPAGRDWEQELYRAIKACRAVLVLCSRHSMASRWCFMEITHARALGKHLFPIRIDDCEIEGVLSDRQVTDLRGENQEEAFARLHRGLLAAGLDPADAFNWNPSRPPYPGLLAFQEEDAAVFFGRDYEIAECLDLLNKVRRLGQPGLVLILGASGTGKSSLVRAGMLPRLRRDVESWLILDPFRPQEDAARELAAVLSRAFERLGRATSGHDIEAVIRDARDQPAPEEQAGAPAEESAGIERFLAALRTVEESVPPKVSSRASQYLRLLRAMAGEPGPETPSTPAGHNALLRLLVDLRLESRRPEAKILLVVDQFEELLGFGSDHPSTAFLRLLRSCVDQPGSPVLVLATIRSDFLQQFQKCPVLLDARFESLSLGPMAPRDVAQVIEKPAAVAGIELEPGLVQALVHDAETEDALPLLAFTLRALNERYGGDRLLELSEYRERLGGLHGAVAKAAEELFESSQLDDAQQDKLRRAFLTMVRITEDGQYARRGASWDDVDPAIHPLIERFVKARLLVAGENRRLEVAHEALFRSWDRLRGWLETSTEALRLRHEIQIATRAWDRGGRDPGDLWRGSRLARAGELKRQGDLQLEALDTAFLEASAAREQAEVAEKLRRARRITAGAVAFSLVVLVLAVVAWRLQDQAIGERKIAENQTKLALEQRDRARDQVLTGLASDLLLTDPTRAALVLLEVLKPGETQLAMPAMVEALHFPFIQAEFKGHAGPVYKAILSPDGRQVATHSPVDKTVRVWAIDSGGPPSELRYESSRYEMDLEIAFSDDGRGVFVRHGWATGPNSPSWQWRRRDGTAWDKLPADAAALQAAFARDELRKLPRESPLLKKLTGHDGEIISGQQAVSGDRVVTSSGDRTALLWSTKPVYPLGLDSPAALSTAVFTPDGMSVLGVSPAGTLYRWSLQDSPKPEILMSGLVGDVLFDSTRTRLLVRTGDRLQLISLPGGTPQPLTDHGRSVAVLAATFSGGNVLALSRGGVLVTWPVSEPDDPQKQPLPRGATAGSDCVEGVFFDPTGRRLLTTCAAADKLSETVRLFQLNPLAEAAHFSTPGHASQLALSPDFHSIVEVNHGANSNESAAIHRLGGSPSRIEVKAVVGPSAAGFSPDGQRLFIRSVESFTVMNDQLRIWSSPDAAGSPIVLRPGGGTCSNADANCGQPTMSPDNTRLLTVSAEGRALHWDLHPGRLQGIIRRATPLCLDSDFRRRVLGESSAEAVQGEKSCRICEAKYERSSESPEVAFAAYRQCLVETRGGSVR